MTSCDSPSADLDPEKLTKLDKNHQKKFSDNMAENALLASAYKIDEELFQSDFIVPNMHCISCIRTLEGVVGKLPFVKTVRANLSLKKITVIWRAGTGHIIGIDQAISDAGFEHLPFDLSENSDIENNTGRQLLIALGVAGFAAANIMLLSVSIWSGADQATTQLFHLISGLIAVPAVFFSGQPFFRSALSALRAKRLNMDVPISLAVLLALAMSLYESIIGGASVFFDAAVTLLFFLLIGRYLDNLMREKARHSVVQLSRLSAKGAMQVGEKGDLNYLPLDQIEQGMTVRTMAGERVAIDGRIIKGQSDVDRSLVTGESVPQVVQSGSFVEAGTLNLTGPVDIRVTHDARHSFLAQVTQMMEAAEKGRGTFTRIADRMAQIYAPAVHLLAALAFVGWMIATDGQWHASLYVAISVLIITCPCALGLAVPVVHVIAARRLFRQGIIIRDGSGFERLQVVEHILFDKTGTLTRAVPTVSEANFDSDQDAQIAKALASHSSHPFSTALAQFIKQLPNQHLSKIREIPACGVEGLINAAPVRLGQIDWVSQIATNGAKDLKKLGELGQLGFAVEGGSIVIIKLDEMMREDAHASVSQLQSCGFELEILSGDNAVAVKNIADQLAIGRYSHGLKPAGKISRIEQLNASGRKVLMVGDGLNDSPALAAAHVSMAPANASDIARHTADFVFTGQSLDAVPFAINIARRTGALVRQNFALAIAYNAIAVPFAMAGYVTPLIAAIAMSASSLVVVLNSMRLNNDGNFFQFWTTFRQPLQLSENIRA